MTSETDEQEQSNDKESRNRSGQAIATWMPIGAGFGVALGLVLDNLALGIAIGVAIGAAAGAAIGQKDQPAETKDNEKHRLLLLITAGLGILLLLAILSIFFLLPLMRN